MLGSDTTKFCQTKFLILLIFSLFDWLVVISSGETMTRPHCQLRTHYKDLALSNTVTHTLLSLATRVPCQSINDICPPTTDRFLLSVFCFDVAVS